MIAYCLSALAEIDTLLAASRRILIAADFDGTLCPIAASPAEARLPAGTHEILRRIGGCQRITLAILSGRPLEDVVCRVRADAVWAGNHGLEIRGRGLAYEHAAAAEARAELEAVCEALTTVARKWEGAWVEDKRLSATLHYRKADPRGHRALRFAARSALANFGARFSLRAGNKALEICPRTNWDKGSALEYVSRELGPFDVSIAVGDDRTDEAMFRANTGQINVKVGSARPTLAEFHLTDYNETAVFLEHVLDVCAAPRLEMAGLARRATEE